MRNFNTNTENKEEWLTPPELIAALGEFDLDPCAPLPNRRPWPMAKQHYDKTMDGLSQPWFGRVWCNPPYGRTTFVWLNRLATHGNGIALIFARTETHGFHAEIWEKADAVFFFEGRLRFYQITGKQGGTANAPSCLIAYGRNNVNKIKQANLKGRLIELKKSKKSDGNV